MYITSLHAIIHKLRHLWYYHIDSLIHLNLPETKFKLRFANHKKSFEHEKYSKESELSKEVWKIKQRNAKYEIKWRVIKQYPSYKQNTKRCQLCLNEKLAIIDHEGKELLNKRSEIISKCRHRNKHKLLYLTQSRDIASDNIT